MNVVTSLKSSRRTHLKVLAAAGCSAFKQYTPLLARDDEPFVRATDGDRRKEPNWSERLTVRVGNRDGDMIGRDDKVIQAALNYVARLGGGTVLLLPGEFTCRNAVVLPSNVRLKGSGAETVLTKIPSETVPLADDSDWYDQEITLRERKDFRVGDGVVLRAKNPHHGGDTVIKRTIVAASGNRLKLDRGLRENLWLGGNPICSSLFPILTSEDHSDMVIEDFVIDGNRENNENFNGNYGGCIFLQDCTDVHIRRVEARNYNGDGISFQICHDVVVEECYSHDNTDLGIHPGSGSQRPRLLRNRIVGNAQGIFWCWGVKFGIAEGNVIEDNRLYGSSIGHNDTDNIMRENTIRGSGRFGLLFRDESGGVDFYPNRNTIERNRIENSGGEDGVAIEIQGKPEGLKILDNEIVESRGPSSRIGIRIHAGVRSIELASNRVQGTAEAVVDLRERGQS